MEHKSLDTEITFDEKRKHLIPALLLIGQAVAVAAAVAKEVLGFQGR